MGSRLRQHPTILIVIGGVRRLSESTLQSPTAVEGNEARWELTSPRAMSLEVSHNSMDWTGFIALAEHGALVETVLGGWDAFFFVHDTVRRRGRRWSGDRWGGE